MKYVILPVLFCLLLVITSACSESKIQHGSSNPVESPVCKSQFAENVAGRKCYPGVLGVWKVSVDIENLTAAVIPARNAAKIGDIYDADLSQFLTVTPCSNCLMISGISFDGYGNLLLGVVMKHPFGNINTRPDLHGFDVRAIIISKYDWSEYPSITITRPDGTLESVHMNDRAVLNPDGYTCHYDELINDTRYFIRGEDCPSNLNPYLRFFESYMDDPFDPHNPTGHNVMPVGSDTYERTIVLKLYYPLNFYIVADVAYGHSATLANRTSPQYYLPSFNRTEPWRMEYWIENNTLAYDDGGSSADIVVQVFDWQHNANVDPSYPDPANLSGLRESSRVTKLELSIPDLQDAPIIVTTPESGTGTPSNPLQYRFTVHNVNLTHETVCDGLIAVRDELDGHAYPGGRAPVPESPAGFPYSTLDIRDYSYYGTIMVNVPNAPGDDEYENELELDHSSLVGTTQVMVKATFFMDPGHKKFQYSWDYDFDGLTFDIDGSGMPSPHIDLAPGKHNIGLRVRTNSVPPGEYIYKIPVYIAGQDYTIQFSDPSTTYDISGKGRSHAVYATDDWFYYAYISRFWNGNREITLGQVKRDRSQININQVTDLSSWVNDPSIAVVEDGPHAGVYIVFERYSDIQFMKGELNGTGFNTSNIKTVSIEPFENEHNPVIIYAKDTLFVYYHQNDTVPPTDKIVACKSTDWGDTWTGHTEVDNTSASQFSPSVVYVPHMDRFYCIYSDYRNFGSNLGDLYLAEDLNGDGIDFDSSWNVSTLIGKVDERDPSMVFDGPNLVIAYLSDPDYLTGTDIWLKTVDVWYYYSVNDAKVFNGAGRGFQYTAPSVSCAYYGRYVVASAAQELSSMDFYTEIIEFDRLTSGSIVLWNVILEDIWGGSDSSQANIYPAVFCRSVADNNAFETYAAFLNYDQGSENVNNKYYGQIDTLCYISRN